MISAGLLQLHLCLRGWIRDEGGAQGGGSSQIRNHLRSEKSGKSQDFANTAYNLGYAYFTVWMAEIPLSLSVPDDKLSQINNWKIPDRIEK